MSVLYIWDYVSYVVYVKLLCVCIYRYQMSGSLYSTCEVGTDMQVIIADSGMLCDS